MKPQIKELLQTLDSFAPTTLAEKWDNVGLLVGSPENRVSSILIGLDPTLSLVEEAIDISADTIITHHPVIFKPLSAIVTNAPGGLLLQKALSHNINIIGAHTNLDSAVDGVNDVLANGLGLIDLTPLIPSDEESDTGLGRIGSYPEPVDRQDFLDRVFTLLGVETINVVGTIPETISSVAVCGGSGSDFAEQAYRRGVDVYLSAEIKHSTAIWAKEVGFAIIDGTHYATEKPATHYLAQKLGQLAGERNWQVAIRLSETEVHPFVSLHMNKIEE